MFTPVFVIIVWVILLSFHRPFRAEIAHSVVQLIIDYFAVFRINSRCKALIGKMASTMPRYVEAYSQLRRFSGRRSVGWEEEWTWFATILIDLETTRVTVSTKFFRCRLEVSLAGTFKSRMLHVS